MEYKERSYREVFSRERWHGFVTAVKDSDLWIGVDKASYDGEMPGFCARFLAGLRGEMESYLDRDPLYGSAMEAYAAGEDAPMVLRCMAEAASKAGVGPMAAVAGAVAREVGIAVRERFGVKEILVENGGDIYGDIVEPIDIAVFAGESPLSERVGLRIPAGIWGVCTSSGTVGPSVSFGSADAVMIVCRDVALADAYATAMANRVRSVRDIDSVVEQIEDVPEILGALLVKDDRMAVVGEFELKIFG